MAAIRITVFYTPKPEHYDKDGEGRNIEEWEMLEDDIESLQNGVVTVDEFIENADQVIYDPMPGVTLGS